MTKNLPKFYTVSQAAEILGISAKTLRRWEKAEKIKAGRTPSGNRTFSQQVLDSVKLQMDISNSTQVRRSVKKSSARFNIKFAFAGLSILIIAVIYTNFILVFSYSPFPKIVGSQWNKDLSFVKNNIDNLKNQMIIKGGEIIAEKDKRLGVLQQQTAIKVSDYFSFQKNQVLNLNKQIAATSGKAVLGAETFIAPALEEGGPVSSLFIQAGKAFSALGSSLKNNPVSNLVAPAIGKIELSTNGSLEVTGKGHIAEDLKIDKDLRVDGTAIIGKIKTGIVDPYLIENDGTVQSSLEIRTLSSTLGSSDIVFEPGGFEKLRVKENGSVKVSASLEVRGDQSISGNLILSSTSPVVSIGNTGILKITDGTNTLLKLTDNGTTVNLETTGDIKIGGNITLSGVINSNTFTSTKLTFAGDSPAIAAGTTNTGISLNANGTGAISIGNGSTGDIYLGGGTTSTTRCTITNSTANINCSGTITGNALTSSGTITFSGLTASRFVTSNSSSQLSTTGSSSDLSNTLSDETGTGVAVFGTSPTITTSLLTGSTAFSLVNTTATTVNFAGAGTTISIGASTGTTTINNAETVTGAATFSSTGSFSSTLTASNGFTLTTGALSLTGTSGSIALTGFGTTSITSTTTSGDIFAFTDTSLNTASANLTNFTFKNNNTGAGVSVSGVTITEQAAGAPSSGTNTSNLLNLSAAANGTVNGVNISSATGFTNFFKTPTFVLDSSGNVSGVVTLTATTLAGTLSTAAQTNVTSVGTLTSLTVTGNISSSTGSLQTNGVTRVDNSGNVTAGTGSFGGNVTPSLDATYNFGSATSRWNNAFFAGDVTTGDVVFKNKFRLTENGDHGIDLLNPKGEKIASFDENGNFWVKGEIKHGTGN